MKLGGAFKPGSGSSLHRPTEAEVEVEVEVEEEEEVEEVYQVH